MFISFIVFISFHHYFIALEKASKVDMCIPLPYFMSICVEAWEQECRIVMEGISRAKVANLRKFGVQIAKIDEVIRRNKNVYKNLYYQT